MREEWIAGLSHDLKTPLSSIKGYGEVLAETSYDLSPDERTGYAATIVRNAVYMEALLDDLRLTSQLKHNLLPMDKRESDVVRLLQETVILLLNSPEGEDRTISFDANPQTILLSFDAKLLQRAFLNLLFNALVHNPAGTQVQVAVSGDESGVRVVIADNGVGISKEDMAKLFDRYYRGTNTAASHQGSGLGLAIARQIIEAHDGKVEVESRLGHGTTIIVHFPQT
nr:HAMP domain-containing sensor histidine kinase [Paenibacillus elgii]